MQRAGKGSTICKEMCEAPRVFAMFLFSGRSARSGAELAKEPREQQRHFASADERLNRVWASRYCLALSICSLLLSFY